MKKLIFYLILAGATVFSGVIVTSVGCSSGDKVGGKGGQGGGGPIIKLDGSVPGKGGSKSTGPSPDGPNCGSQTASTTKEDPDVMLVLDRSSSMAWSIAEDNCYCTQADADFSGAGTSGGPATICANSSDCSSRWSAVKPAVISTVSNTKDVRWGLKFFSSPNTTSQCSVSSTMEVPIDANSSSAVQSQVEAATLSLSTPTAAAIKAATAYLKTLSDSRPKYILLATDGEPNCGGNPANIMTDDINGASSAAAAASTAGFPVYVIGIGPNPGNLTKLAQSGGTKDFYPVSSPEQLVEAFATISKLVASCTFTLTSKPPDVNNIAVYLDKNLVEKNDANGWSLSGNNQSIVLNGDACEKVTSGKASTVQLIFGCGSPPLIIP
jgi:hypothetical protein